MDSQESPLCSIADENETSKLTYKKSVFKKKSTSSTGTVINVMSSKEFFLHKNAPHFLHSYVFDRK